MSIGKNNKKFGEIEIIVAKYVHWHLFLFRRGKRIWVAEDGLISSRKKNKIF